VKVIFWNFAFLSQESFWAAEASECAADQDMFWAYHDKIFDNQNGENKGSLSKENLKRFAAELGLDTDAFNQCLDSGKYTELIQQDVQIAQSLGVNSTPHFLINGYTVRGALPFENFQQAIESLLNN
jgi:protein-disulfide isomerase